MEITKRSLASLLACVLIFTCILGTVPVYAAGGLGITNTVGGDPHSKNGNYKWTVSMLRIIFKRKAFWLCNCLA